MLDEGRDEAEKVIQMLTNHKKGWIRYSYLKGYHVCSLSGIVFGSVWCSPADLTLRLIAS